MVREADTTSSSSSTVGGITNDATREALALYKAGDLARARERYEEVLARYPDHADALHVITSYSIHYTKLYDFEVQV